MNLPNLRSPVLQKPEHCVPVWLLISDLGCYGVNTMFANVMPNSPCVLCVIVTVFVDNRCAK